MSGKNNGMSGKITDVRARGNGNGGSFGVSGEISKPVSSNADVFARGNVDRYQSFNGGGGQYSYGGQVGFRIRF